jgi:hypothetical protein
MLKSGYQSSFSFKTADKVGFIGIAGKDDLDSDLTAYGGLISAIDGAKSPCATEV